MSNFRTQFLHKGIMLGILFLGILLNVHYESRNTIEAVADQIEIQSIEADSDQTPPSDTLEVKYEEADTSTAGLG